MPTVPTVHTTFSAPTGHVHSVQIMPYSNLCIAVLRSEMNWRYYSTHYDPSSAEIPVQGSPAEPTKRPIEEANWQDSAKLRHHPAIKHGRDAARQAVDYLQSIKDMIDPWNNSPHGPTRDWGLKLRGYLNLAMGGFQVILKTLHECADVESNDAVDLELAKATVEHRITAVGKPMSRLFECVEELGVVEVEGIDAVRQEIDGLLFKVAGAFSPLGRTVKALAGAV